MWRGGQVKMMITVIMTIIIMSARSVTTGMFASQQVSRRMRRRAVSHNPKRLPRFGRHFCFYILVLHFLLIFQEAERGAHKSEG